MSLSQFKNKFKYIYGPVYSWRLGESLGVDPLAAVNKVCNLNCDYCQLGPTKNITNYRAVYVNPIDLMVELNRIEEYQFDTIAFSGKGEPTLAENLGDLMRLVKMMRREKIALITNSTFLHKKEVQDDCALADIVCAKLDATDSINILNDNLVGNKSNFLEIVEGLKDFRKVFKGKLCLQVMFVSGSKESIYKIAEIISPIKADEVQIISPCSADGVGYLSLDEVNSIKACFKGAPVVSIYETKQNEEKVSQSNFETFLNSSYK